MKRYFQLLPVFLLLGAAVGAVADAPRVSRPLLRSIEKNLDERIGRLWPDTPVAVVGPTRGVYLDGYGAVFTTEVNMASEGISLMHLALTPQDKARVHSEKIKRLPQLKKLLQEALVDSAGSLDPVPLDEQVVMEVDLDRYMWEAPGGYPAEVIMQAPRRKLLDLKGSHNAGIDNVIRVTEH